ncbi:hypothetical protein BD324DRAFT_625659 [Kockovaella imperatae]|uniref:Uncharacterized protein n=1 Tax=Kockovaella imperatae TaxID=4999 RepID=A0A1Y1UGX2_9TREE|nr:hypothetical protein BD324DRAFT_625659 [Kockovaella imperatae]ORX37311.1 hypothetical protein BD324DRAFT_625659 [Kockovaella imperatae]
MTLRWTALLICLPLAVASCITNSSSTAQLQALLQEGGEGYKLELCRNQIYSLTDVLSYTAAGQEISTEKYPKDESRATLKVAGFNVTCAVKATANGLDGIALRNVQIDGNRGNEPIYTAPQANIEFGGMNSGQLIEYVRSYDPRGWSCMHIAEGPFTCRGATIQYNDIGPCGSEAFQQWADGISLSCQESLVQGNTIVDATDGGIVIFGAPDSVIRDNLIHVKTRTLLGGINMVDVLPWRPEGNFSNVLVENNHISGGFATDIGNDTMGMNNASAIIKIGIGIGPQVWWSDGRYGRNQTTGATIQGNQFSGAFAFAMAISGARDDVIRDNSFVGNVSFIGSYGPNCTVGGETPNSPVPLLEDPSLTTNLDISVPSPASSILSMAPGSGAFQTGRALGLTCFMPPASDSVSWPYGGGQVNAQPTKSGGAGLLIQPTLFGLCFTVAVAVLFTSVGGRL